MYTQLCHSGVMLKFVLLSLKLLIHILLLDGTLQVYILLIFGSTFGCVITGFKGVRIDFDMFRCFQVKLVLTPIDLELLPLQLIFKP
jgi:hypothetical protein